MRLLAIVLLLTIGCVPCFAGTESKEDKAREIVQLLQLKQASEQMRDSYSRRVPLLLDKVLHAPGLSSADQTQVNALLQRLMAVVEAETAWSKMEPLYVSLYASTYSDEELDGILAFYRSPIGRAINAKRSTITEGTIKIQTGIDQRIQPKLDRIFTDWSNALSTDTPNSKSQ